MNAACTKLVDDALRMMLAMRDMRHADGAYDVSVRMRCAEYERAGWVDFDEIAHEDNLFNLQSFVAMLTDGVPAALRPTIVRTVFLTLFFTDREEVTRDEDAQREGAGQGRSAAVGPGAEDARPDSRDGQPDAEGAGDRRGAGEAAGREGHEAEEGEAGRGGLLDEPGGGGGPQAESRSESHVSRWRRQREPGDGRSHV